MPDSSHTVQTVKVPRELARKIRVRLAVDDMSWQQVILAALEEYAAGAPDLPPTKKKRR